MTVLAPRHCADLPRAVAAVIDAIDRRSPGPFDRPLVMVQHRAAARLLTLELARRHGIAASIDTISPMQLVRRLHQAPSPDPWAGGPLRWRIARLLPGVAARVADAHPWLAESGGQLSRAIVTEFRDLLLHRPALLADWELAERPDDWLALLWHGLAAGTDVPSPARRHREWRDHPPAGGGSPILVLADSSLPPLVRETLEIAAGREGVEWYSPEAAGKRVGAASAGSLLGMVAGIADGTPPPPAAAGVRADGTLRIHCCHSPLREIEVLRDEIVRHLAADHAAAPHDVTIYLADLEGYLPAVDAVFSAAEPGMPPLPWHVAGRRWRQRSELAAAVDALLDAVTGRFGRTEILALLEFRAIRSAAGVEPGELATIGRLVDEARIRWGVDGIDRAKRYHLPPLDDGTWRAGLAGLAGRHRDPEHPLLEQAAESRLVALLGDWVERLIEVREDVGVDRTPAVWRELAERWFDDLLAVGSGDDIEAMRELRWAIDQVLGEIETGDPDRPIPFTLVRQVVAECLDGAPITGELRGGVRIAALDAGTVIPARVVMVAGLDDGRWPRRGNRPSWSRFVREPRPGDPDPRADDLALFRRVLASASDVVHLSWTGKSMADNASRAPSVAVAAVLDDCAALLGSDAVQPSCDGRAVLADQPLQPFAAALFRETDRSPPVGISPRWCGVATAIAGRVPAGKARSGSLPVPGPLGAIDADSLAALAASPVGWFWKNILLLPPLPGKVDEEDREPVLACDLDRLALWEAGASGVFGRHRLEGSVELPPGPMGEVTIRAVIPETAHLAAVRSRMPEVVENQCDEIVVLNTTIKLAEWPVVDGTTTIWLPYPIGSRSRLRGWVHHLVAAAAGRCTRTAIHGVGVEPARITVSFSGVDRPADHLAAVLSLAEAARRKPVPFFPRSALAAAEAGLRGRDPLQAARTAWRGVPGGGPGEREDPLNRRFHPDLDFDPDREEEPVAEFLEWTRLIAVPLMAHLLEGAG